jgi:EmrB/QacA subfamily drug resistance transporter
LIVLCVGMLMIVLDNTVVNVALPSIRHDLGFSPANLAWVVNAYMIAFGGLLLLAGRLGDLIGTKRVFVAGLVLFTCASLLCGLSWTPELLVAARFLQGIGGAMASSVILAMIVTTFPQARERAKALGIFSFTASAGGSIGLLLGGTLTQLLNWHWVFLVNVPIGIAAVALGLRLLDGTGGIGLREGADAVGALLVTASLMLAVYTVVEIPVQGATSLHTLACGAAALVLFAAFLIRQATARKPLLPLRLLRSRNVAGTNVLQLLLVAGMYGFFFLDALYLREVLRYDAVATGLAFLPVTVAIGTLSLGGSARVAARFGARPVLVGGIALAAVSLAVFAFAPLQGAYATTIFPAMLLLGVGLGVAFPSLMLFAMAGATPRDAGLTSGLVNTTAQVGGAFGLAILAALAAARTHASLATHATANDALAAGFHLAFGTAAGCLAVAALVAATVLRSAALDDAETVPHTVAA